MTFQWFQCHQCGILWDHLAEVCSWYNAQHFSTWFTSSKTLCWGTIAWSHKALHVTCGILLFNIYMKLLGEDVQKFGIGIEVSSMYK